MILHLNERYNSKLRFTFLFRWIGVLILGSVIFKNHKKVLTRCSTRELYTKKAREFNATQLPWSKYQWLSRIHFPQNNKISASYL